MHLSQLTGINSPSTIFTSYATLPQDAASRILLFAVAGAGFFFFARIIHSGYQYLTSIGDPGKVQSASKNLINAVLGLIIVLGAYLIAQIIFAVLGLKTPLGTPGSTSPPGPGPIVAPPIPI